MNFKVIEGSYADFDSIIDSFINDYIYSTDLRNIEIKEKYNLTHSEFKELSNHVKSIFGLTRRLTKPIMEGKYYYPCKYGFKVMKEVHGKLVYMGTVPSESIAIECVKLCKNVGWDIDESKKICRNYKEYIV